MCVLTDNACRKQIGREQLHKIEWMQRTLRGKRSVVCDDAALYELIVGTADAVLTDRTLDVERLRRNRPGFQPNE